MEFTNRVTIRNGWSVMHEMNREPTRKSGDWKPSPTHTSSVLLMNDEPLEMTIEYMPGSSEACQYPVESVITGLDDPGKVTSADVASRIVTSAEATGLPYWSTTVLIIMVAITWSPVR